MARAECTTESVCVVFAVRCCSRMPLELPGNTAVAACWERVLCEPCVLKLFTSRVPCLYKKNRCRRRVSHRLAVPWMLSARACRPLCAACAYHKRGGVCHMYATHRRSPWGVAFEGPSLLSESVPVSYNL